MHIHEILGWHWGMWIFFIIFWLLIIIGIVTIVRWFNTATQNKESDLEILGKRYAKGEISKEEFEKMTEKNNRSEVLDMKRLVTSALILICLTSLSHAQGMGQQKDEQQGDMMSRGMTMGMEKDMGGHMMGGSMMYGMMIQHILMKAGALDLTDSQKKELTGIKEKYLYPIVQKEADFKISHMKIMDMLYDPSFDPAKLKLEIKTSNQISLEMAAMMVNALVAVRKDIGQKNFATIMKLIPMDCGMMMDKGEMMMDQPSQENTTSSEHEGHHEGQ